MKQKERFDEKPKQEHTEPVHHSNQKPLTFWILPCNLRGDRRFNGFVFLQGKE